MFSVPPGSAWALDPQGNAQHLFDFQSRPVPSGRFEIRRRLGAGGFGVVYEAFDRQRGQEVALKTLHYFEANDVYRLKREFRSPCGRPAPEPRQAPRVFVDDGACFFIVRGRDFLEGMRPMVERRDLTRVLHPPASSGRASTGRADSVRDLQASAVPCCSRRASDTGDLPLPGLAGRAASRRAPYRGAVARRRADYRVTTSRWDVFARRVGP